MSTKRNSTGRERAWRRRTAEATKSTRWHRSRILPNISEICQKDSSPTLVEKREDTFKLSCLHTHKMWFDRGASTLPTDCRTTSSVRQLCQQILVQCVHFRHTRVPTQLDDALQPSAPANSPDTPSRRFSCRGVVQVLAKVRPVSSLLPHSSPVVVLSSCQVPNRSTVAKGFTQFCTHLNQHNNVRQLSVSFRFTHPVTHHLAAECGIHGQ